MTDYSDALKEAYARAKNAVIVYDTIEFMHPLITSPWRFVSGSSAIIAKLEDSYYQALNPPPLKPYPTVGFDAVPFRFTAPSQGVGPTPEARLTLDNISPDILAILDSVAVSFTPIKLIYRVYTTDTLNSGPAITPPPILQVVSSSGAGYLELVVKPVDLTKIKFPRLSYPAED